MTIDFLVLPVVAALVMLYYYLRRRKSTFQNSAVFFSKLGDLNSYPPSIKVTLAWLPKVLFSLASLLFLFSFLDPHSFTPRNPSEGERHHDPVEGRVLFLAIDQSGSMRETASLSETKLDLMKREVSQFIKERQNDLIGLIGFARTATVLSPPTFDHEKLLKDVNELETVPSPEFDGTAIGYAIFKSANLISSLKEQAALMGENAPYTIKGALVVLVTDGLQDPNPLDKDNRFRSMELSQAAAYAKEKGVKVYVINIEPKLAAAKFLPNLREMKKVAESTGGEFYFAGTSADLGEFIAKINKIEASKIYESPDTSHFPSLFRRNSFYPPYLLTACLLFFMAIILKEIFFNQVTD